MNILAIITDREVYKIYTSLSAEKYYEEEIKDKAFIAIKDITHGKVVINVNYIASIVKLDEVDANI